MHDDNIFFGQLNIVAVKAVMLGIFAKRRKNALLLPLQLDAQHHHHIGLNNGVLQLVKNFYTHLFNVPGKHSSGTGQKDLGAHFG
jgi:hypothetical protein